MGPMTREAVNSVSEGRNAHILSLLSHSSFLIDLTRPSFPFVTSTVTLSCILDNKEVCGQYPEERQQFLKSVFKGCSRLL